MATAYDEKNREDSVLNRARDDEPLFILRASDVISLQLVNLWIHQAQMINNLAARGLCTARVPDKKIEEAIRTRDGMKAWQGANFDDTHVPD